METLIVVENLKEWPLDVPGTRIVPAREYLTDPFYVDLRRAKVFNLCRTYAYQSVGYYVSLLAAARGHRALPSVTTLQDLKLSSLLRIASEDLEGSLQKLLSTLKSRRFVLSIYFGKNLSKRYDRLAQMLFTHFPAPLLRAEFILADQWRLQGLRPIAANDIPWNHRSFVIDQARRFFDRPSVSKIKHPKYHLAILAKSRGVDAPSNERAIARFVRAAKEHDMSVEILGKEDLGRIAEFDALFIRETTFVNNHTYRFARRAEAEGLVVIDDPESIVRCTNKVFQSELFQRRGVPTPATVILQRENAMESAKTLGFPCVLKRPDSSFSMGVEKAENDEELARHLQAFFARSELVVAQEFIPSAFDWRIGVLDRKPLFVCKYHMARGHWQIQKAEGAVRRSYGKVEAFPVGEVPKKVVKLGTTAANLIGRGFYGVDVKDVGGRLVVIEVNDNPSVDAGCEDTVLKDDLYMSVMRVFYERLEHRGRNGRP